MGRMSINPGTFATGFGGAGPDMRPGAEPGVRPGAVWRAARRHSMAVTALRVVLPFLALIVIAWMIVSARTLPREIGDIDLGEVGLEGTTLTMKSPTLSGFNNDGTAYEVTAARALQDVTNPRVVTLEFVDGTMTKSDGKSVRVTADSGVFDADARLLDLKSNIVVRTSDDDRAFLESAHVDMQAGSIVSQDPVRATAKSARIKADAMTITERGSHLVFNGGVVVELRLDGGPLERKKSDGQ